MVGGLSNVRVGHQVAQIVERHMERLASLPIGSQTLIQSLATPPRLGEIMLCRHFPHENAGLPTLFLRQEMSGVGIAS
jgi:hypothetical protein